MIIRSPHESGLISESARDQAKPSMGLLPAPRTKSLVQALFSKQDQLTNADRMGLLRASQQLAGGQNGFFSALGGAGAAFEDTQDQVLQRDAALQRLIEDRQIEEQQRAADETARQRQLAQGDRRLDIAERQAVRGPTRAPSPRQRGETFTTPEGVNFIETFDPNAGRSRFLNTATGRFEDNLPGGATRIQQTGLGQRNKDDAKAFDNAINAATNSFAAIDELDRLEGIIDQNEAAFGPEGTKTLGRQITRLTGFEINGLDTAELSQVDQIVANQAVNAAARFRGQGQITEGERKLLADTLPRASTDPEAARTVIGIMRKAQERQQLIVDEYIAAGSPDGKFREFQLKFRKRIDEQEKAQREFETGGEFNTTSSGVRFRIK